MRILCLADRDARTLLGQDLSSRVHAVLSEHGSELEFVEVGPDDVAPCLGCLLCLTKRLGLCVNLDLMARINPRLGDFDVLCYLGPIIFGQFSSAMKNVMDKAQTNRMLRSRRLIAIGYGDDLLDEEVATFMDIVRKHRGDANLVHPLFPERFDVFASRSLDDNEELCRQLGGVL
jgi:NADPH-dependent FMN reductase